MSLESRVKFPHHEGSTRCTLQERFELFLTDSLVFKTESCSRGYTMLRIYSQRALSTIVLKAQGKKVSTLKVRLMSAQRLV